MSGFVEEGSEIYAVLGYASFINKLLAYFNLVPGFPLDGGRLLRSAMWFFSGNFRKSTLIASNIGKGFAFFLMAFGFLQVMGGSAFNGLWMILIGYFLQNAAEGSYRQVVIKELLADLTAEKVMNRRIISVADNVSLQQIVDDYFVVYHFDCFPVLKGDDIVGVVRMVDIKKVERERWASTPVTDVMERDLERFIVSPADGIEAVLRRMIGENAGWFLVADGNAMKGILTRSDIMHLLKIKSHLDE